MPLHRLGDPEDDVGRVAVFLASPDASKMTSQTRMVDGGAIKLRGGPIQGIRLVKVFIALLRGINVGGRNRLPMKNLTAILEGLGARNVRTYIQSGNAVFESSEKSGAKLSMRLASAIESEHGFKPHVLILESAAIADAMARNPFPEAEADPKSLHIGFLSSAPLNPKLDKLAGIKAPSERFRLIGSVFYLHAPDGVGRSKLAAAAEKLLGVPMTDRNWNTVCKMMDMANERI